MPIETTSPESYREDLVSSGIVIKTEELAKVYEMGAEQVRALNGVDLTDSQGRVRRDHGAVGLRQIDADEFDRVPRFAEFGEILAGGAARQRA